MDDALNKYRLSVHAGEVLRIRWALQHYIQFLDIDGKPTSGAEALLEKVEKLRHVCSVCQQSVFRVLPCTGCRLVICNGCATFVHKCPDGSNNFHTLECIKNNKPFHPLCCERHRMPHECREPPAVVLDCSI